MQCLRNEDKTVTPSSRLQAKGEMSTPQTGKVKDLSIHPDQETFILCCPDLITKMFSGNIKYNIFSRFQLFARAFARI